MAIEVRKINLPIVTLTGETITGGVRSDGNATVVVSKNNIRKRVGAAGEAGEWDNRATRIFHGQFEITSIDADYPIYEGYQENASGTTFPTLADNPNVKTFQGSELVNPGQGMIIGRGDVTEVGKNAEVYYSVNGDDPLRTKTNIWTGQPVTIRYNLTGAGNCTLKFKTLYQGRTSDTLVIKLQIARPEKTIV
jgi:hypothetical protein